MPQFILLLLDIWTIFKIKNNFATNAHEQVSLCTCGEFLLEYVYLGLEIIEDITSSLLEIALQSGFNIFTPDSNVWECLIMFDIVRLLLLIW